MLPRITCFGGVGEIGGNKILLEDKGARVFLDFGTGFSEGSRYFNGVISPRPVNGAGDLFEFGILPELPGLYSEKALQNTQLRHTSPEIDAVVLSHFHWDHMGRIEHVDPAIPVYCGETTTFLHEAQSESYSSPLDGHELRTFRTGDRFRIGPMEFVPIHVDHSIPGAYGFIIHTSEGTLAYTGDFRFHGPAGSMTGDFVRAATGAKPDVLLTEGTRVAPGGKGGNTTEEAVMRNAVSLVGKSSKLVLSTFRGNDVDRIRTFSEACKKTGRQLVVSMRAALVLRRLEADGRLRTPRVGKEVKVYLRRKRSGRLDDKDYFSWERQFLDDGVSASEVRKKESRVFLHLDEANFPELVDIKPSHGGTYIHAATEAFNEEGEQDEEVIRNWMEHLGFSYHQLHASGHATMKEVGDLVNGVRPRRVVPVHTDHPRLFQDFRQGAAWSLTVPDRGAPIQIGRT